MTRRLRIPFGSALVFLSSVGTAACGQPGTEGAVAIGLGGSTGNGGSTSAGAVTGTTGGSSALFENVQQAERAVPLIGGTLLVTRDGTTAVAADPDRDRIFLVNLHDLAVTAIEAPPGSVPGRLVEGADGSVFVVAQASGAVLAVDVQSKALTWQSPVCNAPRALDYDATTDSVFVACRSGRVVVLAASTGAVSKRLQFDDDLIDILVQEESLVLMRRRMAEILVVDEEGSIERVSPAPPSAIASNGFRLRRLPSGALLSSHVIGTVDGQGHVQALQVVAPSGETAAISISAAPASALATARGLTFDSHLFANNVGPFDLAVSPGGERFALLSLGDAWPGSVGPLYVGPLDASTGLVSEGFWPAATRSISLSQSVAGEPIAIAFDAKNRLFVQSREPSALVLENGVVVHLSEESRADTGLALFYKNLGGGKACATCHPAAGDDGRGWRPAGVDALARTQSLEGGTVTQAPYFRRGTALTLHAAIERMRSEFADAPPGLEFTSALIEATAQWVGTVPKPTAPDDLDVDAAVRGRDLFVSEGCPTCHSGEFWSDAKLRDIGSEGTFITPKLTGLVARAPYFHDGCAVSLAEVFGPCGGSAHETALTGAARADLLEFLRSL